MARRLIDISVALDVNLKSDPPVMQPQAQYLSHDMTGPQVAEFFPGLEVEQLPDGEGWAIEKLEIFTHNGTHLDAPYHHHSTMNRRLVDGGEPALKIDEVPLEWCLNPGVKLDFRHMEDGYVATPGDIEAELARIGHTLKPLDIVVVNTAAGERYGQDDYVLKGCGVGREATLWMLERGVRVTGTDAWSWDAPFALTAKRWMKERDPSVIWEGHRASMEIGYCHMEKLANLDQLPDHGFDISCFPWKIRGASAGFTRAVAILDD